MNTRKIDHINLQVPNLEKAIEFYTKVMNFTVENRFIGFKEFVFLTDGSSTYELLEDTSIGKIFVDHIAYESNDIKADYEHFSKLGLVTTDLGYIDFLFDNGVDYFFIKGANNEKIEFCQKR